MNKIYLFTGNEELIIKNKIELIINQANPGAYNLTTYDMTVDKLGDAINDAMTAPFLSENKVVVLRHPLFLSKSDDSQNASSLGEYLDNPNDTTYLIIDATNVELDSKKDIVNKLLKKTNVIETKVLSDIEMRGWLIRQFGVSNVEIEDNAVQLFFELVGTDLIKAKNEVDKLINYIGDRKIVSIRDVANCVSVEGETNVFALIKAINERNKSKTMEIYYSLLKNGNDQIKLLNLIFKSMKDSYTAILLIENGYNQNQIATFLGISPGRAYYIMKDAKSFDKAILEKDLIQIGDLDYNIKTGAIDKVSGMELFLFGI